MAMLNEECLPIVQSQPVASQLLLYILNDVETYQTNLTGYQSTGYFDIALRFPVNHYSIFDHTKIYPDYVMVTGGSCPRQLVELCLEIAIAGSSVVRASEMLI